MNKTNCPNCGAPIEQYNCRCKYCGTWYFDFTGFDMSGDGPYYVKFRTPYGVITTLAKPELRAIDVEEEKCCCKDFCGNTVASFITSRSCDLNVLFHSVVSINHDKPVLYTIEAD